MIKALAHATGRSIINVPLSRISTNAELQSILFDKRYFVQSECVNLTMDFKDVIFVMEDIDVASDIVKRRKKDGNPNGEDDLVHLYSQRSIWTMLLQSNDHEARKLVKMLQERSDRLRDQVAPSAVLQETAQRLMAIPGLAVIGNTGHDKQLQQLGEQSLQSANKLVQQQAPW